MNWRGYVIIINYLYIHRQYNLCETEDNLKINCIQNTTIAIQFLTTAQDTNNDKCLRHFNSLLSEQCSGNTNCDISAMKSLLNSCRMIPKLIKAYYTCYCYCKCRSMIGFVWSLRSFLYNNQLLVQEETTINRWYLKITRRRINRNCFCVYFHKIIKRFRQANNNQTFETGAIRSLKTWYYVHSVFGFSQLHSLSFALSVLPA